MHVLLLALLAAATPEAGYPAIALPEVPVAPSVLAARRGAIVVTEAGYEPPNSLFASSRDGGQTWQVAAVPERAIERVDALAIVNGVLYLRARYSLYRSTDFGLTWTESKFQNAGTAAVSIDAIVGGVDLIYAAGQRGLFISSDGGLTFALAGTDQAPVTSLLLIREKLHGCRNGALAVFDELHSSWTALGSGLPAQGGCLSIAEDGGNLYVATLSGLFRSKDAGLTFTPVANAPEGPLRQLVFHGTRLLGLDSHGNVFGSARGGKWPNALLSSVVGLASDGKALWAIDDAHRLWRSDDSGDHWTNVTPGVAPAPRIAHVGLTGDALYLFLGGAAFVSGDAGSHWMQTVSKCLTVPRDAAFGGGSALVTGMNGGLCLSRNGADWTQVALPAQADLVTFAVRGERILLVNDGVWMSNDSGAHFSRAGKGAPPPGEQQERFGPPLETFSNYVSALILEDRILVSTTEGLFTASLKGTNWKRLTKRNSPLDGARLIDAGSAVYAVTSDERRLFGSTDGGKNFHELAPEGVSEGAAITDVGARGTDLLVSVRVGHTQSLLRSHDLGVTWEPPLPAPEIDRIAGLTAAGWIVQSGRTLLQVPR